MPSAFCDYVAGQRLTTDFRLSDSYRYRFRDAKLTDFASAREREESWASADAKSDAFSGRIRWQVSRSAAPKAPRLLSSPFRPFRLQLLADIRMEKYAITPSMMERRRMSRKLVDLGNAALVVCGVFTALTWGARIAYVAGMWFGSH